MAINYVPCPKCAGAGEEVNFTWWGGLLGPKILTHVKCSGCGYKYNGKSGKDNRTGIIIYTAIVSVVCLGLVVAAFAVFAMVAGR